MVEKQIDRITTREINITPNGKRHTANEVVLMPLPKNAGRYHREVAPGIDSLDMRRHKIDPTNENPTVTIEGPVVGGTVDIPLKDGIGTAELEGGREVVVYARQITQALHDIAAEAKTRRNYRYGW